MAWVQFIYLPAGANENQVELGDDTLGNRIAGGLPEQSTTIEARPVAQSDFQVLLDHGNKLNALTWQVTRDHGTEAAAEQFMRDHADGIPVDYGIAKGILQRTNDAGTASYLQGCCRPTVKCIYWAGQTTVFEYAVRGGKWTDTINAI